MADVLGRRPRPKLPVPLLTPRLSSLWIGLMTPVDAGVARPLIEGLSTKTTVTDTSGAALFDVTPLAFEEALRRAVADDRRHGLYPPNCETMRTQAKPLDIGAGRAMRLGFAVKVLGGGGLPSHDSRRWRSGPHLRVSLERLRRVLEYCDAHDIRMYRMATALAPYASHPDLPGFRRQPRECAAELAEVGRLARELDIRLSSHPGQYTVLNSEDERTRRLAVEELEVQAELMDAMGLGPEAVAVLHVGGAAGGVDAALERFEQGFELLSPAARARLAVENDDRSFGLGDVLRLSERMAARSCGTPFTTAATTRTRFPTERRSPLRLRRGRPAWRRRSITRRRRHRSTSAASASADGSNARWCCRSYASTPI